MSVSNVLEHVHDAVRKVKTNAHDTAHITKAVAESKLLRIQHVDLNIQFIGASGLPRMDVVGSADPYFVAKIDNHISFVSTVKPDTLSPVWNENWKIKNVPTTATLSVQVLDKDNGSPTDDYIGKFSTTVTAGAKEAEIEGPVLKRTRGTFWLKIDSTPSTSPDPGAHPYTFDGPIRFSRHFSPTVGRLTTAGSTNCATGPVTVNDRLYSTWKMYIRGITLFFGDRTQHWNVGYKAAQKIFRDPGSMAVRSMIQAGHRMLYARSTTNGFGVINDAADLHALLHGGSRRGKENDPFAHRVKPAVYTYIISSDDDSFRFSETGAAFFVDFASKHALHSNCAETVRYSGEFHPRPVGGWDQFTDELRDEDVRWELVIDNNSGTYAPDAKLLPKLQALLEYNFEGFRIVAMSQDDPELKKSREACRAYAVRCREVKQEELQPHAGAGEETLSHQALARALRGKVLP